MPQADELGQSADDDSVDWTPGTDADLASELDAALVESDGQVVLSWRCPRCHHACVREPPEGGWSAALDGPASAERPEGDWLTLHCVCEQRHHGRPANRVGCGFHADQFFDLR
jgi:hypothetical protein